MNLDFLFKKQAGLFVFPSGKAKNGLDLFRVSTPATHLKLESALTNDEKALKVVAKPTSSQALQKPVEILAADGAPIGDGLIIPKKVQRPIMQESLPVNYWMLFTHDLRPNPKITKAVNSILLEA